MNESALDAVGIRFGTTKSSLEVDFLRHYERELAPFRDRMINVVEIGIAGGASLLTWQQFFSVAKIVGVDIMEGCKRFAGGRVAVEIGSQADADFLSMLCTKYPPTVFIDDGSHRADHIRFTFEHVFPILAPGGCYIIEDLHFHFSPPHAAARRGTATMAPQDYLTELAGKMLGAEFEPNPNRLVPSAFSASIDRMTFIPRAVIIWKKCQMDFVAQVARWELLTAESRDAANWWHLGMLILQNGSPLDRAEHAAKQAIALDAKNWNNHQLLSKVLDRKGDLLGACQAAKAAIDLLGDNPDLRTHVVAYLERLKARLPPGAG